MIKLILFNVLVAVLCASYWNYSVSGNLGFDWTFLDVEIQNIEN